MLRFQYPDVVLLVRCMFARDPNLQSFIIDSEIVAIDPDSGGLRSFQELSNRARKDVEIRNIKIPVCVYAFDLMYLDGEVSSMSPPSSTLHRCILSLDSLGAIVPGKARSIEKSVPRLDTRGTRHGSFCSC